LIHYILQIFLWDFDLSSPPLRCVLRTRLQILFFSKLNKNSGNRSAFVRRNKGGGWGHQSGGLYPFRTLLEITDPVTYWIQVQPDLLSALWLAEGQMCLGTTSSSCPQTGGWETFFGSTNQFVGT